MARVRPTSGTYQTDPLLACFYLQFKLSNLILIESSDMPLHQKYISEIHNSTNKTITNKELYLNNLLRLLSKWRSTLIQNTVLKLSGTRVLNGPFKGMDFIERSAEGCHIAKLLGCYEQPLFPHIEELKNAEYENILNIGCAEGYYSVGFALHLVKASIYAYDINESARNSTKALALKNNVADRVTVGNEFKTEDFDTFTNTHNGKTLLFCDIEGAEDTLLDPSKAESLKKMDIIVELHEKISKGVTQRILNRFEKSHDITQVSDNGFRNLQETPDWFYNLAHLDQLLATWEWRSTPTPWLVMKAKL